jgi:ribonuclease P/MRP protein subunit POP5
MRHLPKHLRPRYRYLAVEIEAGPEAVLDRQGFQAAVWRSARELLGDATSAAVDLQVLDADFWAGGGQAIVRVRREQVQPARAALACLDAVAGEPVRVGVRGVGGTVNATERTYAGGPPAPTETRAVTFREAAWTAHVREDRVDLTTSGELVGATPEEL